MGLGCGCGDGESLSKDGGISGVFGVENCGGCLEEWGWCEDICEGGGGVLVLV